MNIKLNYMLLRNQCLIIFICVLKLSIASCQSKEESISILMKHFNSLAVSPSRSCMTKSENMKMDWCIKTNNISISKQTNSECIINISRLIEKYRKDSINTIDDQQFSVKINSPLISNIVLIPLKDNHQGWTENGYLIDITSDTTLLGESAILSKNGKYVTAMIFPVEISDVNILRQIEKIISQLVTKTSENGLTNKIPIHKPLINQVFDLLNQPLYCECYKTMTARDIDEIQQQYQFLLLTFWSANNKESIEQYKKNLAVKDKMKKNGFLTMGICIDNDVSVWQKAIITYNLQNNWNLIWDPNMVKNKLNSRFYIRARWSKRNDEDLLLFEHLQKNSIPLNILVANGKILAASEKEVIETDTNSNNSGRLNF